MGQRLLYVVHHRRATFLASAVVLVLAAASAAVAASKSQANTDVYSQLGVTQQQMADGGISLAQPSSGAAPAINSTIALQAASNGFPDASFGQGVLVSFSEPGAENGPISNVLCWAFNDPNAHMPMSGPAADANTPAAPTLTSNYLVVFVDASDGSIEAAQAGV